MRNAANLKKRAVSNKQIEEVDISTFNKLKELFTHKQWVIDEDSEISVFHRYYEVLKLLDREQQEFLIEISDRFIHIAGEQYLDNLIEPLKRLREDHEGMNLIFLPCLSEEDSNKIKSSATVLYKLKGTTIKSKVKLSPFYVTDHSNEKCICSIKNDGKTLVVLVDDFVGTGETALGAVDYIHKLNPELSNNECIVILSIVAMQEGVNVLESKGIHVYANTICKKGISEGYSGDELSRAIKLMQEIESKIKKLDRKMRFGYMQSEALVCMERCPNNTFPVYWKLKDVSPYER